MNNQQRKRKPRIDLSGYENDNCVVIGPADEPNKFEVHCKHCGNKHIYSGAAIRRNSHGRSCPKWSTHNKTGDPAWFLRLCRTYQIDKTVLKDLIERQNGLCAICDENIEQNEGRRFAVDHNHVTGEVRGLLCSKCNQGLGKADDSIQILDAAIRYLDHEKTNR